MRGVPARPGRAGRGQERPERPFTGFKLAHAVLSADGARTAFAGLTLGASRVYGVTADASCVWNSRHATPRRWCGCGFYCLHELAEARSLGCATENRSALLIEVTASGRYVRYERGLRYSRQRVRAIWDSWCACGRYGVALADAGTGLVGWRRLTPVCGLCAAGRPVLRLAEFAARLDGPVRIEPAPAGADRATAETAVADTRYAESPIAVLTAEIALLHARLDDLQSRLGH
jgi:hypothetical protein